MSLALALATAWALFRVGSVLQQNPFGLPELADLGAAALCAFASWSFYRFLAELITPEGLSKQHPGHVAGWLVGGVWVTACAGDMAVESPSQESDAVFAVIKLGTLLGLPLVAALLIACLRRRERARADWRAWVGFVAGCTIPLPFVLFIIGVIHRL